MKDYELNYLKKKLIQMREEAENSIVQYDNVSAANSTQELSMYDNHPADLGSETYEKEKQLGLKNHSLRQIEEINEALRKIDRGEYGICELCGREIGFERLDVLPAARFCIKCKKERSQETEGLLDRRPVEEDVTKPPFGRTFTDGTENNVYDGEDTLQDVLRYGRS